MMSTAHLLKKRVLFCVFLMFTASLSMQAMASSDLYKFCHHEVQQSETTKATIIGITAGLLVIKATLNAANVVQQISRINASAAENAHSMMKMAEPVSALVPSVRAFFKAILPTLKTVGDNSKRITGFFDTPFGKTFVNNSLTTSKDLTGSIHSGGFTNFVYAANKVFRVWDYTAPVVLSYFGVAKAMCAIVKEIDPNCRKHATDKEKNKCGLKRVYHDLPDGNESSILQSTEDRSCASGASLASQYIQLSTQLAPVIRQMRSINSQLNKVLKPLGSALNSAKSVMGPLKSPLGAASSALKVLKAGLTPFNIVAKELNQALDKQICVKVKIGVGKASKQTKKCSRIKNLIKDIKKFVKPLQKAFEKATDKIINPIIKKLQRQVMKLPGISQITSAGSKMANSLGFTKGLGTALSTLKSTPFANLSSQINSATTKLTNLRNQFRTAQ